MTGMVILLSALVFFALAGAGFAFSGAGAVGKKRMTTMTRQNGALRGVKGAAETNQQRRKNVQTMLKELDLDSLTPREAQEALYKLRELLG